MIIRILFMCVSFSALCETQSPMGKTLDMGKIPAKQATSKMPGVTSQDQGIEISKLDFSPDAIKRGIEEASKTFNPYIRAIILSESNLEILQNLLEQSKNDPSIITNFEERFSNTHSNSNIGVDTASFIKLLIIPNKILAVSQPLDYSSSEKIYSYLAGVIHNAILQKVNNISANLDLNENLFTKEGEIDDEKIKITSSSEGGAFTEALWFIQIKQSALTDSLRNTASQDGILPDKFETMFIYKEIAGDPKKSIASWEQEGVQIVKNDVNVHIYSRSTAKNKIKLSFDAVHGIAPSGNLFVLLYAAKGKPITEFIKNTSKDLNIFRELGVQLGKLHQAFVVNAHTNSNPYFSRGVHGDFHPNNIFYDEHTKTFTLIDLATMAVALNGEFYNKTGNGEGMRMSLSLGKFSGETYLGVDIMQDLLSFIFYPSSPNRFFNGWQQDKDFRKSCTIPQLIDKIKAFLNGYVSSYKQNIARTGVQKFLQLPKVQAKLQNNEEKNQQPVNNDQSNIYMNLSSPSEMASHIVTNIKNNFLIPQVVKDALNEEDLLSDTLLETLQKTAS